MPISPFGILTADDMADLVKPAMLVEVTAFQSAPNNTPTLLDFGSALNVKLDNAGMVDVTNDQAIVPLAGLWSVKAVVVYLSNATGQRFAIPRINGLDELARIIPATTGIFTTNVHYTRDFVLAEGDTVQFRAQQSSGGALNARLASFSMHLLAAGA